MRRAPLLNVLLLFAAGIVTTFYLPIALPVAATVAAVALAAALMTFAPPLRKAPHPLFQVPLALFCVAMGIVMVQLRDPLADTRHYRHHTAVDATYSLRLRLLEAPVERPRTYRATAEVQQVGNGHDSVATQGRILIYLPKDSLSPTLRYGDLLAVRGRLTLPPTSDNPYQFDYRRYLQRKGVVGQCRVGGGDWQRLGHERGGLTGWSKALQQQLLQRIQRSTLSPSQRGIAEALLLGWRNDLDEATQSQFRDAGIMHLLCVSGLHVGIVAALIGVVCRPLFRRRRWMTQLLQLGAIWLFVLITGMAPATLRAGIMFSFFVVAHLIERQHNNLNTLAAAVLVMLVARPTLVADIGFQLSFASVFGIILLYKPMYSLIPFRDYYRRSPSAVLRRMAYHVWQLACLSTAAQLGALPVALYHFHQFPTWFLIANITVVPAAGLLVGTTLLLALLAPLPAVAQGVGWLLQIELGAVDALTRWVQRLPGALVDHIYCDGVVAALLAATVAALAVVLQRRDKRWLPAPLLGLVLLLGYWLHVERAADTQRLWIVYDIPYRTAVEFFDGHNSVLLADERICADSARMDYVSDNLLTRLRVRRRVMLPCNVNIDSPSLQVEDGVIHFCGHRIEVADQPRGQLLSFEP